MKLLLFSGSLRKDSLNKQLLRNVAEFLKLNPNLDVTFADIQALNIPVYDADIEAQGFPEGVKQIIQSVKDADAIIISSPEYNGSISSPLKNTVDWVSRQKPQHPWAKKPVLLMSASPGNLGGMRNLMHTPQPFLVLGSYLYPNVFSLAKADQELKDGEIKDTKIKERLEKTITGFLDFANKLTHSDSN